MYSTEQRTSLGLQNMRRELAGFSMGMVALAVFLFLSDSLCSRACRDSSDIPLWISNTALAGLVFLCGRIIFRLLRSDVNTLWTPAVLMPLGTMVYFGFGSASTLYSSQETRRFLLAGNYGLDAAGLMQTMLLTTAGIAIVAAAMTFMMRIGFGKGGSGSATLPLPVTAIFFVVSGAMLKYGLVLPNDYGLINVSVPGSLKSLTALIDLGLAVMAFMAARGRKVWMLIFFLIWPVYLGLSLLEFSKRVTMFAILLPAAGAYLGHQNWKRLIPWILFAALSFAALQDVNTSARLTILNRTGTINQVGYEDRTDILKLALFGQIDLTQITSSARNAAQVWWLRLNYSGAQLRAMELYDSGRPGEWTLSFASTFIPRFLWSEKPEAAEQARLFNRIVSGNPQAHTQVGITIYADGYWQMGWLGLGLFSSVAGLILGLVTRVNYKAILRRDLIYLPMIFFGMRMATLGVFGFLQKSFVAARPIYIGYLVMIFLLQNLLSGHRSGPSGQIPARSFAT